MGNADPRVVRLFVELMESVYGYSRSKMRCYLHLRADQKELAEVKYWCKVIGITPKHFCKTQYDKRTEGQATWTEYHGVCTVYCYSAPLQKRVTLLQSYIFDKLLKR